MKDLEIRGAGNLLGGEQSGHIEGVGFDLYVRMVGEAVAHFKGEAPEETVDVKVDLPVDAHLPHDYVGVERLRLEMYRKIAQATSPERLAEIEDELRDRYGAPPEQVRNLLAVARLRLFARARGLTDVSLQGRHIRFAPLPLPDSKQLRLKRYYPDAVYKAMADQVSVPRPTTKAVGGEPLRDVAHQGWCEELLTTQLDPPRSSQPRRGGAGCGGELG
jgi:transcription-repair coupling factor (superfamily II helicase)